MPGPTAVYGERSVRRNTRRQPMDYRLYHAVNELVAAHAWVGHAAAGLESWAIPAFAIATFALWLLARPGAAQKWKLACASALASAGMAFVVNQAVAQLVPAPAVRDPP